MKQHLALFHLFFRKTHSLLAGVLLLPSRIFSFLFLRLSPEVFPAELLDESLRA